ncbi:MAG: hypothetical protein HRT51_05105 [Colwellia sp.]|nr:hypothetical protein [Colwellia sp.]
MTYKEQSTSKLVTYFIIFLTGLALTACNGHADKDTPANGSTDTNKIIVIDTELSVEQSVELILFYPDDKLSNIHWQQTAGENITLLTDNTKVIAFTPNTPGEYGFTVDFSVNGSASKTLSQTINISETANKIAARLSHAVLSDNKVSLRTSLSASIIPSTLTWQQISGSQIDFSETNTQGDLAIFFNAPVVNKDTLLTFKVSASDGDKTYTDYVAVLVEPALTIASNAYLEERVARVYPYNSNSPYAEKLVQCVYSNTLSSSCTLASLPLLAQESLSLSVNNIMDRVVVSHQWMGDRFRDFLINNDNNNDFKRLLRATTAIVISYDIRPSFYWVATGAIYLDAENFWLTPQERDTINEAPDFRADFGNDLQFVMPWRYVKDNNYATEFFSRKQRVARTSNDGFYRLASLLYHELAHANDFFPSTEWFIHNEKTRILDAATSTDFESDQLSVALPLQNQTMRGLAQVSFVGKTASTTQKSYLPTDIKGFFSPDTATDSYAYSSLREDYAMLFEELMMQSRFQVFRDVAITDQPTGDNLSAQDYIVTWGQRGRIGEASIKPRVAFSASRVLPEFDSNSALAVVPAPIAMTDGDDWLENLAISPLSINSISRQRSIDITTKKNHPIPGTYRYYQKALPKH